MRIKPASTMKSAARASIASISAASNEARVCARASTTTVLMRCAAAKASPGASARSEMTAWMRAGHCSCARARTSACILLPRPEMRMTRFLMLHMRYSEAMLEFPCYFQEFRTAVLARGAAPSSAAVRNTSFCPNGDCTCLDFFRIRAECDIRLPVRPDEFLTADCDVCGFVFHHDPSADEAPYRASHHALRIGERG